MTSEKTPHTYIQELTPHYRKMAPNYKHFLMFYVGGIQVVIYSLA